MTAPQLARLDRLASVRLIDSVGLSSLNFTLNRAKRRIRRLQTRGIQVLSTDDVLAARLQSAGLATFEIGLDLLLAKQDKIWVRDPDGTPREVFCRARGCRRGGREHGRRLGRDRLLLNQSRFEAWLPSKVPRGVSGSLVDDVLSIPLPRCPTSRPQTNPPAHGCLPPPAAARHSGLQRSCASRRRPASRGGARRLSLD